MSEEKTLALACVLQTCVEKSGVPNRHSLGLSQRTLKVYGLLMALTVDDIVDTSLLKPMGDKHGTHPTPEEEAASLGKEIKLPISPGSFP